MSDIRALLDQISTRHNTRRDAEDDRQQSPREVRRRAERIAEITAHATASFNAPNQVAFTAVLFGGERVHGVVTAYGNGAFVIATRDGQRTVEIEDIDHSGTNNI